MCTWATTSTQQNPNTYHEPVARLTINQFMDRFEGFITNMPWREVEVRIGIQNTIERACELVQLWV